MNRCCGSLALLAVGSLAVAAPNPVQAARARKVATRAPGSAALLPTTSALGRRLATLRSTHAALPKITAPQRAALTTLIDTEPALDVRFDALRGTVREMTVREAAGKQSATRATRTDPEQAARSTLRTRASLLGLRDPDRELVLAARHRDADGETHLRFAQRHLGIPVWRREIRLHYDTHGALRLLQGSYVRTPSDGDATPRLDAATASAQAWADVGEIPPVTLPSAELVFYGGEGDTVHLAWMIDVAPALNRRWRVFVDARTGTVLARQSRIHDEIVAGRGADLFGTQQIFNVWHEGASYYLIDPSTPTPNGSYAPLAGLNATGDMIVYDADYTDATNGYFYVTSAASQSGWDPTAVTAAAHTLYVYEYYLTRHARESIDNAAMNLVTVVHFEQDYANAFWNGTMMVYGDGDGTTLGPLAKCLDIAAHELTHGVTENSAGLLYENQSGALNESFSDVFGSLVENTAHAGAENWRLGEDCTLASPGYLRSLADPSLGLDPQPVRMTEYQNLPNTYEGDYGGVHVNSGIPNRAAYLIAAGLTTEGLGTSIGMTDTARLYYAALTDYLSAYAQFGDARDALIAAATALWGESSAQASAVRAAWDAVEVYDGETPLPHQVPTSATPAPGDDVVVYLYPQDGAYDPDTPDADAFDVYMQIMPQPFPGYNPAQVVGPLNTGITAAYTRPAAYTSAGGTFILYVGSDNNIYATTADGAAHEQLTTTGDFYSIAVSPDGRTLVYTTPYINDNHIYAVDLTTGAQTAYALLPTGYDSTVDLPTIEYADSLAFDYTGRRVVFDALNCVSVPGSSCATGDGYRYYSIGLLSLVDGDVTMPFPSQSPAVSIGYPTFASNNDHVVAFDQIDGSGSVVTAQVLNFDLVTRALVHVLDSGGIFSIPSFAGDDAYVIGIIDDGSGMHAYRVPLDAAWAGNQQAKQQVNDDDMALPLVHRAAVRSLATDILPSSHRIDFAEVPLGDSSTARLTLSNDGARDIHITDIRVSNSAFSHNGANGLLPRGASMTVAVTFRPGSSAKKRTGTLTIVSDADTPELRISLAGNGPVNDGGGGCQSTPASGIAVVATVLLLLRRRRTPSHR